MVAQNPLFRGRWTMKRFNATVINDIWPEVLFFSLVATMVALVSEKTGHRLVISTQLLTVLGTVLGLVISFRTSSAYERYQDGRKMWTNISIASRNLAQMFWIHVPIERNYKPGDRKQTILQCTIEKKTMVNLVQAFSVSVKHYLRGEAGVYYQDLYPLICMLPRYANTSAVSQTDTDLLPLWRSPGDEEHPFDPTTHYAESPDLPPSSKNGTLIGDNKSETSWYRSLTGGRGQGQRSKFDPEKALPEVHSHRPLRPSRNPPQASFYDYFPIFRIFRWIGRLVLHRAKTPVDTKRSRRRTDITEVESNIPLEICLFLSSYSNFIMRSGLIQPAIATGITANLTSLQDTMSNLERIASTPLPFAYQAHLRMSLWLYLLFLPFQIFDTFGYLTIPGTAFASFLLLGFLEIGQEIENPFNYDLNDLDLDHFCLAIQRELHEITAHIAPEPHTYIFSSWNQPFAPHDRRKASDLTRDHTEDYLHPEHDGLSAGLPSIRKTLVRNWHDVNTITRKR